MNKLYAVYIYSFKFWVEKKDCRNYTKMRISMIVEVFSFSIVPKLSLIWLCSLIIQMTSKTKKAEMTMASSMNCIVI